MDFRLTIFFCLLVILAASAYPGEQERVKQDVMRTMKYPGEEGRAKRDVMETMKSAWNEVVRTLSDAGDAVVHVFRPTEKSVIDKMADGVKSIGGS